MIYIELFPNVIILLTAFKYLFLQDKTLIENATEPERNPENEKKLIEMQTFLLAYLTAKVSLPVYLI